VDRYVGGDYSLQGKLMFPSSNAGRDDAAYMTMNDPSDASISDLVRQGYLVRTRADELTNGVGLWCAVVAVLLQVVVLRRFACTGRPLCANATIMRELFILCKCMQHEPQTAHTACHDIDCPPTRRAGRQHHEA
jgi:hypothetical protein